MNMTGQRRDETHIENGRGRSQEREREPELEAKWGDGPRLDSIR